MESKRKKRQVHKVQPTHQDKPTSEEALIVFNANLVDELFKSQAWIEIVFPLLQESIASVSGRFTNGRFWQGALTKTDRDPAELRGYQLALEEFHNRLHDFIIAKDRLKQAIKTKEAEKKAPLYNPMMEEFDESHNQD